MGVLGFFLIEGFSEEDGVVVQRPKKRARGKIFEERVWYSLRHLPGKGRTVATALRYVLGKCSSGCWLTHSLFRVGNACGKKPFPHLQGVNTGCSFMWFCKFLSLCYPGRLMICEPSLQMLGF